MPFESPTLSAMRTVVLRSLRDPDGDVFPTETITDFICQALSDLSDYRPKEVSIVQVWPIVDLDPPPFAGLTAVWMVQYRVAYDANTIRTTTIPPAGNAAGDSRAGWSFWDKQVLLPPMYASRMTAISNAGWPTEMVVWGYGDRDQPVVDEDVLDLEDSSDYLCVLNHCKHLGFELLNHDRALYQQWIAATNNTDVSPTQLQGMSAVAEQTYDRTRRHNIRLRRVTAGDIAYSF
jgi:hypothetical protein